MVAAALFFYIDGTLVTGTSSAQHLASYLGHRDALAEAEAAWDAGLLDSLHVELLDARHWAGADREAVQRWLRDLLLVDGIPEVLDWCARHDVTAALATLAWETVGTYLCETYGFAATCGPRLECVADHFTGAVSLHFDELAKRDFAIDLATSIGLPMDRCAAIGDGRSDIPLFQEVGLAVAFNATDAAAEAADVQLTGGDLRAVLPALQTWLDGLDALEPH